MLGSNSWAQSLLFFLCFPAHHLERSASHPFFLPKHNPLYGPYLYPLSSQTTEAGFRLTPAVTLFRKFSTCISLFSSKIVKNPRSGLWRVGFMDGLGRRYVIWLRLRSTMITDDSPSSPLEWVQEPYTWRCPVWRVDRQRWLQLKLFSTSSTLRCSCWTQQHCSCKRCVWTRYALGHCLKLIQYVVYPKQALRLIKDPVKGVFVPLIVRIDLM